MGNKRGKMEVVYLAGPLRGNVEENIQCAEVIAARLWGMGYPVISPHLNSGKLGGRPELGTEGMDEEAFIQGTFEIMRRADILVLMPGWESSIGTKRELRVWRRVNDEDNIWVWDWGGKGYMRRLSWEESSHMIQILYPGGTPPHPCPRCTHWGSPNELGVCDDCSTLSTYLDEQSAGLI